MAAVCHIFITLKCIPVVISVMPAPTRYGDEVIFHKMGISLNLKSEGLQKGRSSLRPGRSL
jgi:hypothetical protein